MKQFMKKTLAFVLCAVLAVSLIPAVETEVQAASVKLNKTSIVLSVKQQSTLKMEGTKKKAAFSSSNASVASVSGSGVVTAKREGSATITARVSGKKYTCKVTVKGNWKTLYKKKLESDSNAVWYYVKDLNKDGLPDMITTSGSGNVMHYRVFTIKNGKVVFAGECAARGYAPVPFFYYLPKVKAIYTTGWTNYIGGSWGNAFVLSGTKLVHKYHAREAHNPKDEYYTGSTDTKAKKVSKASYVSFCKKYFSGKKTFYMKKNTADNRNASFNK